MRPAPALAALCLLACAPEPSALPAPEPSPWQREEARPLTDHGFFDDHPALTDLSTFAMAVHGPIEARPDHAHRGAFGTGNGRAFALLGMTDPLNTLHGAMGPRYHREGRFTGDLAMRLEVDGSSPATEHEAIGRPRGTSLVLTRADYGSHVLHTVDFGVLPAGVAPTEVPPALVRFLLVRAEADGEVSIRLDAVDPIASIDGLPAVSQPEAPRYVGLVSSDLQQDEAGWTVPLGELRAGDERVVPIALVFSTTPEGLAPLAAELRAADLEAWLDETVAEWHQFTDRSLRLDVDDPVLLDLYDGLLAMLRVQQSDTGGVSPLSRYAGTWLRDTIGPVRFYDRAGLHDEARAALDYLYLCHRQRGDIGNSCNSGLRPDDVTQEVDWDALPPFSGRTAAEGPSHLPLAWADWARWTGEVDALRPIWPYLRRSLLQQQQTEDGLQPWSGDETFRLAMAVAFGYPLEWPWDERAWSSNSSWLMMGAGRALSPLARRLGEDDDADQFDARVQRARDGIEQHFLTEAGHVRAALFRDPEDRDVDLPYEDANLAALWSGALDPTDPLAVQDYTLLHARVGREDGSMQSPPDPMYDLPTLNLSTGVATGMLPGYALWSATELGAPHHPAAFDQVLAYASPSGEYHEGLVYGDRAAFQPFYDDSGGLSDVAARFRPWEGGIVGDAMLAWLLGVQPGLQVTTIRPRVPNGLSRLHARQLRVGGAELSLTLSWQDGWTLELQSDAPLTVAVELPLGVWAPVELRSAGPSGEGTLATLPLGEQVMRFPELTLKPGEAAVWTVR